MSGSSTVCALAAGHAANPMCSGKHQQTAAAAAGSAARGSAAAATPGAGAGAGSKRKAGAAAAAAVNDTAPTGNKKAKSAQAHQSQTSVTAAAAPVSPSSDSSSDSDSDSDSSESDAAPLLEVTVDGWDEPLAGMLDKALEEITGVSGDDQAWTSQTVHRLLAAMPKKRARVYVENPTLLLWPDDVTADDRSGWRKRWKQVAAFLRGPSGETVSSQELFLIAIALHRTANVDDRYWNSDPNVKAHLSPLVPALLRAAVMRDRRVTRQLLLVIVAFLAHGIVDLFLDSGVMDALNEAWLQFAPTLFAVEAPVAGQPSTVEVLLLVVDAAGLLVKSEQVAERPDVRALLRTLYAFLVQHRPALIATLHAEPTSPMATLLEAIFDAASELEYHASVEFAGIHVADVGDMQAVADIAVACAFNGAALTPLVQRLPPAHRSLVETMTTEYRGAGLFFDDLVHIYQPWRTVPHFRAPSTAAVLQGLTAALLERWNQAWKGESDHRKYLEEWLRSTLFLVSASSFMEIVIVIAQQPATKFPPISVDATQSWLSLLRAADVAIQCERIAVSNFCDFCRPLFRVLLIPVQLNGADASWLREFLQRLAEKIAVMSKRPSLKPKDRDLFQVFQPILAECARSIVDALAIADRLTPVAAQRQRDLNAEDDAIGASSDSAASSHPDPAALPPRDREPHSAAAPVRSSAAAPPSPSVGPVSEAAAAPRPVTSAGRSEANRERRRRLDLAEEDLQDAGSLPLAARRKKVAELRSLLRGDGQPQPPDASDDPNAPIPAIPGWLYVANDTFQQHRPADYQHRFECGVSVVPKRRLRNFFTHNLDIRWLLTVPVTDVLAANDAALATLTAAGARIIRGRIKWFTFPRHRFGGVMAVAGAGGVKKEEEKERVEPGAAGAPAAAPAPAPAAALPFLNRRMVLDWIRAAVQPWRDHDRRVHYHAGPAQGVQRALIANFSPDAHGVSHAARLARVVPLPGGAPAAAAPPAPAVAAAPAAAAVAPAVAPVVAAPAVVPAAAVPVPVVHVSQCPVRIRFHHGHAYADDDPGELDGDPTDDDAATCAQVDEEEEEEEDDEDDQDDEADDHAGMEAEGMAPMDLDP